MVFFEKHEESEMISRDNQLIKNPISLPPPVLQIKNLFLLKFLRLELIEKRK